MKKILLVVTLLFSVIGFSQALTDGKYGVIFETGGQNSVDYDLTFTVEKGIVNVDGISSDGKEKKTLHKGTTTTMTWVNTGGIWSESQTYIFTKDTDNGSVYIHYLRVVQNSGEVPWNVSYAGYVYKL